MAEVVCNMECKHRSKRPMRKYRFKDGRKCYGCTLDAITVARIVEPDGNALALLGEENMAQCRDYEPIDEE